MANLEELIRMTNSEPYLSDGGIRVKEFVLKPWEKPDLRFVFEILIEDQRGETEIQKWELCCNGFWNQKSVPAVIPLRAQLTIYHDHPLLWKHHSETFITLKSSCEHISALMGDLFNVHNDICGAWIDFGRLYHFLPGFLGQTENKQISVPTALVESFVKTLEKYSVKYIIDKTYPSERKFQMLFCSYPGNWPDDQNFGQPHIIAEEFSAHRL